MDYKQYRESLYERGTKLQREAEQRYSSAKERLVVLHDKARVRLHELKDAVTHRGQDGIATLKKVMSYCEPKIKACAVAARLQAVHLLAWVLIMLFALASRLWEHVEDRKSVSEPTKRLYSWGHQQYVSWRVQERLAWLDQRFARSMGSEFMALLLEEVREKRTKGRSPKKQASD